MLSSNAVCLALVVGFLLAHLGVAAKCYGGAVPQCRGDTGHTGLSGREDGPILGLIDFEVAMLLVSIVGARRLAWLGFAAHIFVSLAALAIVLTFRMDRLF